MAFFLWYRNVTYDRVLTVFIVTLGLVGLLEYGVHSGGNINQIGTVLFLLFWLQCVALAIGVSVILESRTDSHDSKHQLFLLTIGRWLVFLYAVIFLLVLFFPISRPFLGAHLAPPVAYTVESHPGQPLSWARDGQSMLGNWWLLYALGILGPWLLLVIALRCADLRSILLLAYLLGSAFYTYWYYGSAVNVWCYLGTGFAFLAWFLGEGI